MSDLAERRRIQNRLAQRAYRKKLKRKMEDLEKKAASKSPEPVEDDADIAASTRTGTARHSQQNSRPSRSPSNISSFPSSDIMHTAPRLASQSPPPPAPSYHPSYHMQQSGLFLGFPAANSYSYHGSSDSTSPAYLPTPGPSYSPLLGQTATIKQEPAGDDYMSFGMGYFHTTEHASPQAFQDANSYVMLPRTHPLHASAPHHF